MPLQKINLKTQSQWTNTDIDNALNLKADDNAVVHTTWNENISWVKTFNGNVWINTINPTEKLDVSWNIKTTAEFRQITTSRSIWNDKRVKNWNNNGWIKFVEYIDADWAVVWNKTWQLWGYPLQSSDWAAVWYDRFLSVWYDNYTEDSNWKSLWTQQKWFQVNASKHLLLDWNVWIWTDAPQAKTHIKWAWDLLRVDNNSWNTRFLVKNNWEIKFTDNTTCTPSYWPNFALASNTDWWQYRFKNSDWTWLLRIWWTWNISMPNIPTSDPSIAWELWNDSGTVKISAW